MPKEKKEETALSTVENVGALANIDFGDDAGVGTQNMTSADQAIPFLVVVQALSKVVSDPSVKIKGAESGMILDTVAKKLYSGETGFTFLPCNTSRVFVAWKGEAGSGSPAGRYAPSDPVVKEAQRKFEFNKLEDRAGNRLVETFYVIGMVLDDNMKPISYGLIPFTSTKIKSYKESFGVLKTIPGNAPIYAFPVKITTRPETRPKGTAYNFCIKPLGHDGNVFMDGVTKCFIPPGSEAAQELWPLAKQIALDFDAGTANIAYDSEGGHGGDGGGSEDEPY